MAVLGTLLFAAPAGAHQDTVAHSRMVMRANGEVEYALKIPVEDLAESLGRQGHAPLNAHEVRAAEEQLFHHFLPLVGLTSAGAPCPVEPSGIDVPEDERLYGELRFVFYCPPGAPVTLDYRVFFDVDPGHMGMLEVETPGGKTRAELIRERPRWEVHTPADGPPEVRAVEGPVTLPPKEGRPTAAAQPVIAEPAQSAEPPGRAPEPAAPPVANVEAPAHTSDHPRGNWMAIALVLVVAGAAAFHAMRVARRRPSPPPR